MLKLTICLTLLLLINTAAKARSHDFPDLSHLGEQINNQVQEQLRPLQNLGPQIAAQVNHNLRPLQNLGPNIQKQVYQKLKPVREMQSRLKIRFGEDGPTVVTYSPSGKTFIIQGNDLYECQGQISKSAGTCSGNLNRFAFKDREDFCYATSYSSFNDWFCFTTGGVSSGIINGKIFCDSTDNSSTLLIRRSDYINLCSPIAQTAQYTHFTNNKLVDVSPDVHCTDGLPQVCTMTENLAAFGRRI